MSTAQPKPHSPSCERNREPILSVLREHFADRRRVLEIGSGTGQHAVHFAAAMPWLQWQCSDRAEYLPGIRAWLDDARLPNTPPPLTLDVVEPWPLARDAGFDAAFSANTLHIMGWPQVQAFFAGLDRALAANACVVVYGPFNDDGRYSSDSNREFDGWLKAPTRPRPSATPAPLTNWSGRPAGAGSTTSRCRPPTAAWSGAAARPECAARLPSGRGRRRSHPQPFAHAPG